MNSQTTEVQRSLIAAGRLQNTLLLAIVRVSGNAVNPEMRRLLDEASAHLDAAGLALDASESHQPVEFDTAGQVAAR